MHLRGVLVAIAVAGLAPSSALAAGSGVVQSFSLQPRNAMTQAGGDPFLDSSIQFGYSGSDSVKSLQLGLPPGLLAAVSAVNTLCTTNELQNNGCPPDSNIGSGTIGISGNPFVNQANATLYLMPPLTSSGIAGIGAVLTASFATATAEGELGGGTTSSTNPRITLRLDNIPESVGGFSFQITYVDLTINGQTATDAPFTRLPSSCQPAITNVSVTTWGGATGAGSDSFTPTGCDKLAFAPKLTATATRDASDAGARLVTTITQAGGEAAIAATTLTVPRAVLAPNLNAAGSIGSTAPIGTVMAQSPLLRTPLTGQAFLAGTASAPVISLRFAPPFGFTLDGAVSLAHDSVTFADLPDVPLTSLSVTLNGLFDASCVSAAGTVTAGFTGQNGAVTFSSTQLEVIGCPPTVSHPSLAGLATGRPSFSVKLTKGAGAAPLHSISVTLPAGLSFTARGLSRAVLTGGSGGTIRLKAGALTITFKHPTNAVLLRVKRAALKETTALRNRVRHHQLKTLTVTIRITDTNGHTHRLIVPVGA